MEPGYNKNAQLSQNENEHKTAKTNAKVPKHQKTANLRQVQFHGQKIPPPQIQAAKTSNLWKMVLIRQKIPKIQKSATLL